ncbi:hypothetical protein [Parasynechococcus sp.]|uniref:hypothetical protein n=1 Tax=Parasynechococcus sp. TaxID=3101203 RepID=UPI003704AF29
MGITAEATAMEGNPVAAQGVVGPLLLHPLATRRMHPHGIGDLLQQFKASGGGLLPGHADGHREGIVQLAVVEQKHPATAAQHHHTATVLAA